MRYIVYFLLFQCLLVCRLTVFAKGQSQGNQAKKAVRILKANSVLLDSIKQLIVVFNETPEQNSAVLVAMEKKNKIWQLISKPITVGIGRKGFAAPYAKREGDNQSPSGFFRLGGIRSRISAKCLVL